MPPQPYLPIRGRALLPLTLLLLGSTLFAGCAAEVPTPPPVSEPTSALRPEAQRGRVPAEARIADYELDAHLDTETHEVTGTARLTWRNTTRQTVGTVPFHLYLNGFRAEDTAWMKGAGGSHRGNRRADDGQETWGYIDVKSVELVESAEGDAQAEVGPRTTLLDWREDEDPSTMTVDLPREVGPGETISMLLQFQSKLPKVFARTGHAGDFYAVAQWYPKVGVLEEDGWQAHTFTVHDEFYADFGNYRVTLDVPEDLKVGATGIRVEDVPLDDGRRRLVYEAEMVHDFVWMGDPNFVEHYGEYEGIRIRQLIRPDLLDTADDHLDAIRIGLASYESRYGPYPWSTVTLVHPPKEARGASGMEYPTLFTSSDRAQVPGWVERHVFRERMSGRYTTIHELGHQYFQGLFASREHLEPWLDEGLNSMANYLVIQDAYDDPWVADLLSNRIYMHELMRIFQGDGVLAVPLSRPASAFEEVPGSYGQIVYGKTSASMNTLRNLVGHEVFDRAFRAYCDFARFAHPRGSDLERILIEEIGERPNIAPEGHPPVELDLRAFFDQALHSTQRVDFALRRVTNERVLGRTGWHRDEAGELVGGEPPPSTPIDELDDAEVRGRATILRRGAFVVPVEVLATFTDGSQDLRVWDAQEASITYDWPGRRLKSVQLDPQNKLLLEPTYIDNFAYVPTEAEDDGLSRPFRNLVEAIGLTLAGGLIP